LRHRRVASQLEELREDVTQPEGLPEWQRHLLTDPQTSGGLLVACAQKRADDILKSIVAAGYPYARIIGHTEAGPPRVRVSV